MNSILLLRSVRGVDTDSYGRGDDTEQSNATHAGERGHLIAVEFLKKKKVCFSNLVD